MGEQFVAGSGGLVHYCHRWKRWLVWNGHHWASDETGEIYRKFFAFLKTVKSEKERESYQSEKKAAAAINLARSIMGVPITPEQLNTNPHLFNAQNCTINLQTGDCYDPRPEDYITAISPVPYDPEAKAPKWRSFLRQISREDDELQVYLQRAVGYSLSGEIGEHALFFLYGTGANGKSTFLNTVLSILGDDYGTTAPKDFLVDRRTEHPTATSVLYNARFVTTVEPDGNRRLAESLTKQLTGGDRITTRRLYENFWSFSPTHKIWLAANHKPNISGQDTGIWRRIKLIPFTATIEEEHQILDYDKIMVAEEAPGILAWAVQGAVDWAAQGLVEPAVVVQETSRYRDEMDIMGSFLDENCEYGPYFEQKASDLYKAYRATCQESGHRPVAQNAFGILLKERGFVVVKRQAANFWSGLRLATMSDDELFH